MAVNERNIMNKDKQATLDRLNAHAPKFVAILGGTMVDYDIEKSWGCFEFEVGEELCHSGDVVQGGFITAMLDIAMSHAAFVINKDMVGLSSLEIKTSYIEATRAGKLRVEGVVLKNGYKTAFLEGKMYNSDGVLTATASTVAKLIRKPKSEA